jgi:hypothetical protein
MAATKKKAKKKAKRKRTKKVVLKGEVVGQINGFPIRRIKVGDIDTAEYNPRDITESALDGLKASVAKFGLPQPVVWNKQTQRLVGGHQRLKTIDPDEMTDVIEVDLTEIEEKALNVTLNNPEISGNWTERLGEIIAEIKVKAPDLIEPLNLDTLVVSVPEMVLPAPPEDFPEFGEDIETNHSCPKCGYEWS